MKGESHAKEVIKKYCKHCITNIYATELCNSSITNQGIHTYTYIYITSHASYTHTGNKYRYQAYINKSTKHILGNEYMRHETHAYISHILPAKTWSWSLLYINMYMSPY